MTYVFLLLAKADGSIYDREPWPEEIAIPNAGDYVVYRGITYQVLRREYEWTLAEDGDCLRRVDVVAIEQSVVLGRVSGS